MADGRWQMADGRWQMADGRWQADGQEEEVQRVVRGVRRPVVEEPEQTLGHA